MTDRQPDDLCPRCGWDLEECECPAWETMQDCGCPLCYCSNQTEYGVTCNECITGAHQG
jgi:hypothetical protein